MAKWFEHHTVKMSKLVLTNVVYCIHFHEKQNVQAIR